MTDDADGRDSSQPALVVTYGSTSAKQRLLDRELILIGRGSVCDFCLVSPEVAQVHCVVCRTSEGWKLRDCSGRPGVRVNGRNFKELVLTDGDVIQIGAFTLQARLPGCAARAVAVPRQGLGGYDRLQKSRRRLAERLLQLRRLLVHRTTIEASLRALRIAERDFQLRMTRLELSERDLATDRATLEKEYSALQEEMQRNAAGARTLRDQERMRAELRAELAAIREEWSRETVMA